MSKGKRDGPGRPFITEVRGISDRKIKLAYETFGSCRRAAQALGVSYQTVHNYLKRAGVEMKQKEPKGPTRRLDYHMRLDRNSRVACWFARHAEANMPRSDSKIGWIIGVSREAVFSYRKKRIRWETSRVEEIMSRVEKATNSMIGHSAWAIDPYTFLVVISGNPKPVSSDELEEACEALEREKGESR